MSKITVLPEEIEQLRDRKWRREEILKIETVMQVEALVEDLGFCLALTRITRSQAEKIALAQFRLDYPNFRRCFTLKQRDGELDIAMIAYGSTRPPTRIYYVNRTKKPGSPRSRGRFQISF